MFDSSLYILAFDLTDSKFIAIYNFILFLSSRPELLEYVTENDPENHKRVLISFLCKRVSYIKVITKTDKQKVLQISYFSTIAKRRGIYSLTAYKGVKHLNLR